MNQKIYQIDAFADKVFSGNPAAVCPLEKWLPDDIMQKIAMENNLAETAFFVKDDDKFQIRWFTPATEVDLCGHATLATAFAIFRHEGYTGNIIHFYSPRSGDLTVTIKDELLTLNFPTDIYEKVVLTKELTDGFDIKPKSAYKGKTDYMLIFDNEDEIKNIKTDMNKISALKARGVIITAKGNDVDFVSRFFAPQVSVNEDPVTGSAHTTLTPYWAKELNKREMTTIQLSARKGYLWCKYLDDRVEISGQCKLYMLGEIYL